MYHNSDITGRESISPMVVFWTWGDDLKPKMKVPTPRDWMARMW